MTSYSDWVAPVGQALQVYQTTKIVQLNDRRLGCVYYSLLILIVFFVLGFEILYSNDHFDKRDVTGTPQMNIQQPTKNGCNPSHDDCESNFTPLVDLPYCTEYRGNSSQMKPEFQHECVFADSHTLVPSTVTGSSIFIPTRFDQSVEVRDCMPSPSNNYTCRNEFQKVNNTGKKYVADIERYTLLISHSYQRDTVSGNNNQLEGSYLECKRGGSSGFITGVKEALFGAEECPGGYERRRIRCATGTCDVRKLPQSLWQRGRQSIAMYLEPGATQRARRRGRVRGVALNADGLAGAVAPPSDAYAIPDGDVFSIAKLLRLAGISLDRTRNLDDEPLRDAGAVLDIEVVYNNLHHFTSTFGNTRVEYWYKVAARPLHQVKKEIVVWSDEHSERRVIENRHGIDIVVKVQGTFGFFSIVNLVLMLTTAAAMLTVATVLTDKIAMNFLADRAFYSQLKYQVADAPGEGVDEKGAAAAEEAARL